MNLVRIVRARYEQAVKRPLYMRNEAPHTLKGKRQRDYFVIHTVIKFRHNLWKIYVYIFQIENQLGLFISISYFKNIKWYIWYIFGSKYT